MFIYSIFIFNNYIILNLKNKFIFLTKYLVFILHNYKIFENKIKIKMFFEIMFVCKHCNNFYFYFTSF